ncbi:uncharacterized protein K02A2.6 [Trichonephila clavata]|uniref:Uncharacterized protein K02A2.6 n=1 Tax=Trichonephila clavata TaxID=2740835 RepID=A0A8X6KTP2_TRICU|nr:uncharacterized protein K02A2.6 [Trichonephila clavata]
MEQKIPELLRQNQELIRTLQIRDHSSSHKVTVQFEKVDEENENFDSFIEKFETYLDVQNVPIANRAKVFVSSLSAKLYQLLKNLLAPAIPSDQTWLCERPIAFASRTLSGSEKKYSQIDKEALSIVWAVKKFYLYLKGRRFTLITDHKPLIAIFGSKRCLPVLAATRLLHCALILQSFEFDIIFRKTIEHGNADFLSRLPKTSEELEVKDDITIFQMSQIEALPVTSKELRQETGKDIELDPLLKALREGKDLQGREAQYTIEDDCIMYGQRWKNIDKDIEEAAKNCVDCARYKADPTKAKVHYWEYPSMPWERIHVDFAGPIFEHMFFLIVDVNSKWLEVYPMKTTTTKKTIECLRDSFARFGLPRVLVSYNGSQFTSYELQSFMQRNGVNHKTSAPFKPSSNEQAELYVATLKQSLRAMHKYI